MFLEMILLLKIVGLKLKSGLCFPLLCLRLGLFVTGRTGKESRCEFSLELLQWRVSMYDFK